MIFFVCTYPNILLSKSHRNPSKCVDTVIKYLDHLGSMTFYMLYVFSRFFSSSRGFPKKKRSPYWSNVQRGGGTSVDEMGQLATEWKRRNMVEEHVINHFKTCKTIEEVYEKHGDKITKEEVDEFVQGMFEYFT